MSDVFKRLEQVKQDYDNAIAQVQKEFQENEGKPFIEGLFKPLFDAIPNLEAIRWRQYIPYFNDGDECTFGVHEPSYKFTDSDELGYADDGFMDLWEIGWAIKEGNLDFELTEEQNGLIRDVNGKLQGEYENLLEAIFGSHAEITVFPDRVEVEEYVDHD